MISLWNSNFRSLIWLLTCFLRLYFCDDMVLLAPFNRYLVWMVVLEPLFLVCRVRRRAFHRAASYLLLCLVLRSIILLSLWTHVLIVPYMLTTFWSVTDLNIPILSNINFCSVSIKFKSGPWRTALNSPKPKPNVCIFVNFGVFTMIRSLSRMGWRSLWLTNIKFKASFLIGNWVLFSTLII